MYLAKGNLSLECRHVDRLDQDEMNDGIVQPSAFMKSVEIRLFNLNLISVMVLGFETQQAQIDL